MKCSLLLATVAVMGSACTKNFLGEENNGKQGLATVAASANQTFTKLEHAGTTKLSVPRSGLAVIAAGGKIFFAGGTDAAVKLDTPIVPIGQNYATVDIYDVATGTWTVNQLSVPRTGVTAAVAGNKVLFAGGTISSVVNGKRVGHSSSLVDIYDLATGQWSTSRLSLARTSIAATSAGTKAYFAGGLDSTSSVTNKIDVYDGATSQWSTLQLLDPKRGATAITVGEEVFFAGGGRTLGVAAPMEPSYSIEIYNTRTNSWRYSALRKAKLGLKSAILDNKIFFASGSPMPFFGPADEGRLVEIYNPAVGGTNIQFNLNAERINAGVAAAGDFLVVAGGNAGLPAQTADIYNHVTGGITTLPIASAGADVSAITVGNRIYVAGGRKTIDRKMTFTNVVDIFELRP